MPKTLNSGKVDFEFTESFWKTYKPDSVDGKLLTAALKRFEKLLKAAQKEDEEDDLGGTDEDVVSDKLKAWGAVVSGLTEIKMALEKTIPLLGKDKESHVNLKESLERALTQMKRGSHVQQMAVNKKKDKYLDLQSQAMNKSNPPPEEENKEFETWLKKLDKKERRNWAQAGREFQSVVDLNKIEFEEEVGLAINDVFF
ncbi:MAG: hypothetical protein J0M17_20340, partial [Planctomycetes bacterium]|nr:hypothetical protein [Planctomycetota bacterium]